MCLVAEEKLPLSSFYTYSALLPRESVCEFGQNSDFSMKSRKSLLLLLSSLWLIFLSSLVSKLLLLESVHVYTF